MVHIADPSPLAALLAVVPAHVFQHAPRAPRSRLAIQAPSTISTYQNPCGEVLGIGDWQF